MNIPKDFKNSFGTDSKRSSFKSLRGNEFSRTKYLEGSDTGICSIQEIPTIQEIPEKKTKRIRQKLLKFTPRKVFSKDIFE